MDANVVIPDFGDHHLPKHTKFQAVLRNCVSFLSSWGCCSEQHMVPDLELEEKFEAGVTRRRHMLSSLGGDGDLAREANLLAYQRVSCGLHAMYEDEPEGLKEHILETGKVLVRRQVLVPPEDETQALVVFGQQGQPDRGVLNAIPDVPSLTPEQASFLKERAVSEPVMSRTVAAVLVAVDARLGVMLPNTEVNARVVEKVAAKLMRDVGFRNGDISRHLPQVCECYFVCRENQELAGERRRRVPRWLLKLLGFRSNTTRLRA